VARRTQNTTRILLRSSLREFGRSLPKDRALTRRQAQQALATAAALFAAEVAPSNPKPMIRVERVKASRVASQRVTRGRLTLPAGFGEAFLLQPTDASGSSLTSGNELAPVGVTPLAEADSGITAKLRTKIADLFAIGERIAAASGAKQLQVTVGLPWTATIALSWDLPNKG
jgi:hypothetical protein